MKRALLCSALIVAACNSTPVTSAAGEFTSPTGIGVTGAGDRDLVFIANTGRDSLRAIQLCNAPLLPDGGVDPADTCPEKENRQLVPAPIRLFPATIETGERPLRVAGVRLKAPDGLAAGIALAVGADSTVAVVDARSLLAAQDEPGAQPHPIDHLDVGSLTVDVVAANPLDADRDIEVDAPAGSVTTAFVATESELLVLDVSLDAAGTAQRPSIRGRCSLSPVAPTKLALVPGSDAQVYVADGAGDGVVSIATSSVAGGPCTMDRITAGGRSVRSISLSPRWYDEGPGHPAGELLMMVLEPLNTAEAGKELDPGGVLFAQTGIAGGPKGIVPNPAFKLEETTQEPMQPLSLPGPGLTREATFLRAVKPRPSPLPPDLRTCTGIPCTPLYVGFPTTSPTHLFNLLAAVTSTDGATYFIDVPNRRFVNQNAYAAANDASIVPTIDQVPLFSPATLNAPVLTIDSTRFEPGVTHKSTWRAIWHSAIPGIDRQGGTVTHAGAGTLAFTSTATNFELWQNDSAIRLAVGDVVSFGAYSIGADGSAGCQAVLDGETPYRFELPIVALPDRNTLVLGELPDSGTIRGFHPDECSSFGAVAEIRTGGAQPWLVLEGITVKGRVEPDGTFVARQPRFDYPRQAYSGTAPPSAANDVAFTFAITGNAPSLPKSGFTWLIGSGQAPVSYADAFALAGLATAVHAYSSPRYQNLVFSSITGSNEVLQADPGFLISALTGLVPYR
jgi:hypothetical protein